MEKPLSSRQRDEVVLRVAKEELEFEEKKMLKSYKIQQRAWKKWLIRCQKSLTSLGQQLGNGLAMLAQSNINNPTATVVATAVTTAFHATCFIHIATHEHKINFKRIVPHFTSMLDGSAPEVEEEKTEICK